LRPVEEGDAVFTVATWNVENLFLPGGAAGPSSDEVYRVKLAYLSATINAVGPDVICLQELGGEEPLADLVAGLVPGFGGRMPHSAHERGDAGSTPSSAAYFRA
jgi:endonuclease/exonuclease/phosphatase family metal-dependent hydrolase